MLHVVDNFAVTQSHSRLFEFTPLSSALVSSIVTMVIYCNVSEVKQETGQKSRFFISLYTQHTNNYGSKTVGNIFVLFSPQSSQILGISRAVNKFCKVLCLLTAR